MNYLAHAYLSFNQEELLVGNFIGDFVKGKQWESYPLEMAKGILLHREIDYFTDRHPEFIKCKRLLSPHMGHYASLFPDLIFDHFLANDARYFSNDSLKEFSEKVYQSVELKIDHVPKDFSYIFWRIKSGNWLYTYRFRGGIENAIRGLVRRSNAPFEDTIAVDLFRKHAQEMEESYQIFFPELESFVKELLYNTP